MKYTVSVEIEAPRTRVVELLADSGQYKAWQPSLLECSPVEGEPGCVGAKTKLVHKMGRRQVEMLETIESLDNPEAQRMTYVANGVWNEVINRFEVLGDAKTRWTMESEFRCKGVMRVLSALMPGMFKKESLASMRRFKEFAERT